MRSANGRIPLRYLAPLVGHLAKNAAGAWNQMNCEARRLGVEVKPLGPSSSYRPYDVQVQFWSLYLRGGNTAARREPATTAGAARSISPIPTACARCSTACVDARVVACRAHHLDRMAIYARLCPPTARPSAPIRAAA